MRKEEIFYVPSFKNTAPFKELTIGQYKSILIKNNNKPFLNIGFNLALLETIDQNNIDKITLTSFDKYIIAYQLRCSIFDKQIPYRDIEHPKSKTVQNIVCCAPNFKDDIQYYEYINLYNKNQTDELLLAEIAKYINIVDYTTLEEKINFLKEQDVKILAECISYIDNIKNTIKQYYIKNNGQLIEYGVKLLLP